MGGSRRRTWVVAALAAVVLPCGVDAQAGKAKASGTQAESSRSSGQARAAERARELERQRQEAERAKEAEAAEARSLRQRLDGVEKEVKAVRQSIAKSLGIEIHGILATNYTYNFNDPESKQNRLRVFNVDHNSIVVDLANIRIQRVKPDGVGFVADLDFGKTAEIVGSRSRWSNDDDSSESTNSFEARQFYLTYTIPETLVTLQAGRFVSFHGAEIIKAYNNQNYNISNSIIFSAAVPFTHTGLLATVRLPDDLGAVSAGITNGWDSVVDNNDSKSLITNVAITPHPMVAFNLSTSYGAEQDDNGESKRLLVNPILTVKPVDEVTLMAEYVYGNESNVAFGSNIGSTTALIRTSGNASWQGASAYAVWNPLEELQLALRAEVFDDPDGVRTLFQEIGRGPGATFWSLTPTIAYRIIDGLVWRAEYRHEESDKHFYDRYDTGGPGGTPFRHVGQDTIATEILVAF